jgi:hypothetical protein
MKKSCVCLVLPAACMLVACDQNCPTTGSPNTTYVYSYFDSNGESHLESFKTDGGGNGVIPDVPENIDCSKITFRKDTIAMEESQV